MRRLLPMFALFSLTLFAAGYNGAWKAQVQLHDSKSEILFTLKSDGDKLTGTMKNEMGEFPLQNGSIEGEDVFFTVNVDHGGVEVKTTFRGRMCSVTTRSSSRSKRAITNSTSSPRKSPDPIFVSH